MALIKCKECGKMISDDAGACPQCGKPIVIEPEPAPQPEVKSKSKAGTVIFFFILIIAAAGIYYWYTNASSEEKKIIGEKTDGVIKALAAPEKQTRVVFDEVVNVKEDAYHHVPVNATVPSTVTIEYAVTLGQPVDVFAVNHENYQRWLDKKYREVISIADLTSSAEPEGTLSSSGLPVGVYHVIVDNTNYGKCAPPTNLKTDVSTVKVKITVADD